MLYNIVNFSDPYTLEVKEFIPAALAIMMLGNGVADAGASGATCT